MQKKPLGCLGLSFVVVLAAVPNPAFGESVAPEREIVELQKKANELCEKGEYDKGTTIFEEIAKDKRRITTRLHYIRCLIAKKEWVPALNLCDSVIDTATLSRAEAKTKADEQKADERIKWAHELCDPVRAEIPRLHLVIRGEPERVEKLRIVLDGRPLDPAIWRTPILVNPGAHRLDLRMRGEGAMSPIEVNTRTIPSESIPYPVYIYAPDPPPRYRVSNTLQKLGIGFLIFGAAGVVTSAVLLGTTNQISIYEARTKQTIGFGAAGGVCLGLGVSSVVLGHRWEMEKIREEAHVSPFVGPSGIGVRGVF